MSFHSGSNSKHYCSMLTNMPPVCAQYPFVQASDQAKNRLAVFTVKLRESFKACLTSNVEWATSYQPALLMDSLLRTTDTAEVEELKSWYITCSMQEHVHSCFMHEGSCYPRLSFQTMDRWWAKNRHPYQLFVSTPNEFLDVTRRMPASKMSMVTYGSGRTTDVAQGGLTTRATSTAGLGDQSPRPPRALEQIPLQELYRTVPEDILPPATPPQETNELPIDIDFRQCSSGICSARVASLVNPSLDESWTYTPRPRRHQQLHCLHQHGQCRLSIYPGPMPVPGRICPPTRGTIPSTAQTPPANAAET